MLPFVQKEEGVKGLLTRKSAFRNKIWKRSFLSAKNDSRGDCRLGRILRKKQKVFFSRIHKGVYHIENRAALCAKKDKRPRLSFFTHLIQQFDLNIIKFA